MGCTNTFVQAVYSIFGGTTRYTHTRPKLPDQLYTQLQVHDTNMPDPRDTTQVYPPPVLRTQYIRTSNPIQVCSSRLPVHTRHTRRGLDGYEGRRRPF